MRPTSVALLCAALIMAIAPAAHASYEDVPSDHWAADAIRYTSEQNDYLAVSGDSFKPTAKLTRRVFARALVRAFAPNDEIDPDLSFADLPSTDAWFKYAAVAAQRGWLTTSKGAFKPEARVSKRSMDRALVRALELLDAVRGLMRLKEAGGDTFKLPTYFAYQVIAGNLRLHHNHPTGPDERFELYPWESVTRADAAYALMKAKQAAGGWMTASVTANYASIALPSMSDGRHAAVEFALNYVGYPYVYAGEWHRRTTDGYCCGAQRHGGFDCSGFVWWTMKRATSSYDNTHVRPYRGWSLPERASYQMAGATDDPIDLEDVKVLDLVFFDSDDGGGGAGGVDHAGLALGNGWMIHSSGGRAGVTLDRVADGWWADAFVMARRIVG